MKNFRLPSPRAFTLIELLLGTAIFAIVAVTLYTVFFSALKIQKQSFTHEEAVYQMSLGLETMARDLENTVGYNFANSYPKIKAFDGGADHITLIQPAENGLRFVSYYIEKMDQDQRKEIKIGAHSSKNTTVTNKKSEEEPLYQLMRKTQPLVDRLNESDQNSETKIICRNVKAEGLKFAFGAMNPDSGERSWQTAWSFNVIPALVRMDLTTVSPSSKQAVVLRKEVLNPSGTMIVE